MATTKDKWQTAVAKLIQKTQANRLRWKPINLRSSSNNVRFTSAFITEQEGKSLRIYRIERDEANLASYVVVGAAAQKKVALEIVNSDGTVAWTFPYMESLADLLSAIEYQAAGIDEFLEGLLRD
jgi:hypothetical protein